MMDVALSAVPRYFKNTAEGAVGFTWVRKPPVPKKIGASGVHDQEGSTILPDHTISAWLPIVAAEVVSPTGLTACDDIVLSAYKGLPLKMHTALCPDNAVPVGIVWPIGLAVETDAM
jgi:hypothetical protein